VWLRLESANKDRLGVDWATTPVAAESSAANAALASSDWGFLSRIILLH
jgi:hypothetical protein